MTYLFSTAELRRIEAEQALRLGDDALMHRAGLAIARVAASMAGTRAGPIVLLAGPGNNGGDARIAARYLADGGLAAEIIDAGAFDDSARGRKALQSRLASASLIVDGLFGIGLERPISGPVASIVEAVNASRVPVLAIDVPSGIDADTGIVVGGADGASIRADRTLALIGDKPGLHMNQGSERAGAIVVDALGLDEAADGALASPELFRAALRPRAMDSHKGSFGTCVLVGGSPGMAGAITLSARSALFGGAGRVVAHRVGATTEIDGLHPEIMWRSVEAFDPSHAGSVVAGPGLGTDDAARRLLERAWDEAARLVLDADALTLLARHPSIADRARPAGSALCLTPHPLEAARLLDTSAEQINHDRIVAATTLARRFGAEVVLKGHGSIVASASTPHWTLNPTGNAGLASGGTGDVLAGLVGALLSRPDTDALAALRAAVYLHGAAADDLVAAGTGPIGLTASELLVAIRSRLNRMSGS